MCCLNHVSVYLAIPPPSPLVRSFLSDFLLRGRSFWWFFLRGRFLAVFASGSDIVVVFASGTVVFWVTVSGILYFTVFATSFAVSNAWAKVETAATLRICGFLTPDIVTARRKC